MLFRVNGKEKFYSCVTELIRVEVSENLFDQWIDGTHDPVKICGLAVKPSTALKLIERNWYDWEYDLFWRHYNKAIRAELKAHGVFRSGMLTVEKLSSR